MRVILWSVGALATACCGSRTAGAARLASAAAACCAAHHHAGSGSWPGAQTMLSAMAPSSTGAALSPAVVASGGVGAAARGSVSTALARTGACAARGDEHGVGDGVFSRAVATGAATPPEACVWPEALLRSDGLVTDEARGACSVLRAACFAV
jgi:hypothetical protein